MEQRLYFYRYFQLVVNEVAHKFAQSHFTRGVRKKNVRLLTTIIIDYVQVNLGFLVNILLI